MGASNQYQLIITQEASDDIFDLHGFYEEMQIGLGDEFMDAVGNCLLDIEENPYHWQYAYSRHERIRRALIRKPPVVILYEVENTNIYIGRVKDTRSNWQ
ncbi:MAG: type II toxin-antitoxin system RelE/ParE family toxin [Bacteroidota bacterium]